MFSGRFRPGQSLQIDRIAVEHGMDKESVLNAFAEFQGLGMITLANDFSASVNPPDFRGMRHFKAEKVKTHERIVAIA
jgi:DNA-binding GntR family transcriptional regulator